MPGSRKFHQGGMEGVLATFFFKTSMYFREGRTDLPPAVIGPEGGQLLLAEGDQYEYLYGNL